MKDKQNKLVRDSQNRVEAADRPTLSRLMESPAFAAELDKDLFPPLPPDPLRFEALSSDKGRQGPILRQREARGATADLCCENGAYFWRTTLPDGTVQETKLDRHLAAMALVGTLLGQERHRGAVCPVALGRLLLHLADSEKRR